MKTYTIYEEYTDGSRFEWLGSTYLTLEEASEKVFSEGLQKHNKNGCGQKFTLIIKESERPDDWDGSDW